MSLVFKDGSFTGGQCLVKLVSHNVVPRLANGYPAAWTPKIAIEGTIAADAPTAISAVQPTLNGPQPPPQGKKVLEP